MSGPSPTTPKVHRDCDPHRRQQCTIKRSTSPSVKALRPPAPARSGGLGPSSDLTRRPRPGALLTVFASTRREGDCPRQRRSPPPPRSPRPHPRPMRMSPDVAAWWLTHRARRHERHAHEQHPRNRPGILWDNGRTRSSPRSVTPSRSTGGRSLHGQLFHPAPTYCCAAGPRPLQRHDLHRPRRWHWATPSA